MMADGSALSFTSAPSYLGNPFVKPRNLTLGMWLKYSGTNDVMVYTIKSTTIWHFSFHNGLYEWGIAGSKVAQKVAYQMPDILSYNTWHHVVLRATKEVMKFTVNGETRDQRDISNIINHSAGYGAFILQQTSDKGIVGFLDSVSISNDYKSDEFVKEWYDREKKNYA